MTRTITHFVDGAARPGNGGRTAPVMNPSTGREQARVELASAAEVDEVIANAEQAQVGWAKTNPQKRIRIIMKWISLINDNIDELARTLSLEHGKTFEDAKGDIARAPCPEFSVGAAALLKGEFSIPAAPARRVLHAPAARRRAASTR